MVVLGIYSIYPEKHILFGIFFVKFYILKNCHPVECDLFTWGKWFEQFKNRIVAKTEISSNIRVSTIFLGIDHGFGDEGPPLLFETMVFGGPADSTMERYSTWNEAEQGHEAIVETVRFHEIVKGVHGS